MSNDSCRSVYGDEISEWGRPQRRVCEPCAECTFGVGTQQLPQAVQALPTSTAYVLLPHGLVPTERAQSSSKVYHQSVCILLKASLKPLFITICYGKINSVCCQNCGLENFEEFETPLLENAQQNVINLGLLPKLFL